MTRTELRDRWVERRKTLLECGANDQAKLIGLLLDEFDAVAQDEGNTPLTLRQAALLSGYSEDHLGLLLRRGTFPNAGRKGAPRIRAADLPRKPAQPVASRPLRSYDVEADARSLRNRRHT